MYAAIRFVLLGGGGVAIVYAMLNLRNLFPNALLGLVAAGALFYVSQFVQPPEAEEAPPPDIDMDTDFRKQMAESRRQRKANLAASSTSESAKKDQ